MIGHIGIKCRNVLVKERAMRKMFPCPANCLSGVCDQVPQKRDAVNVNKETWGVLTSLVNKEKRLCGPQKAMCACSPYNKRGIFIKG